MTSRIRAVNFDPPTPEGLSISIPKPFRKGLLSVFAWAEWPLCAMISELDGPPLVLAAATARSADVTGITTPALKSGAVIELVVDVGVAFVGICFGGVTKVAAIVEFMAPEEATLVGSSVGTAYMAVAWAGC